MSKYPYNFIFKFEAFFWLRSAAFFRSILVAACFVSLGLGQAAKEPASPKKDKDGDASKQVKTPAAQPDRFGGAFIQYSRASRDMKNADWKAMLDAMREAGMKTIIIQWHHHVVRQDGTVTNLDFINVPRDKDGTRTILDYAKKNGMKVFMGLWFDDNWWPKADPLNDEYLSETGDFFTQNTTIARALWDKYGKEYNDTIAGWYIPQEPWNVTYTPTQIDTLRSALARVSQFCKTQLPDPKNAKDIAISPIFSPVNYLFGTPEVVEAVYGPLLTGAGIDIIMLQDGVGARCWNRPEAFRDNVPRYFAAYAAAVRAASDANVRINGKAIRFWADVEAFVSTKAGCAEGTDGGDFKPACIDRLRLQIATVAPLAEEIVAFDFLHYMDPVTPDEFVARDSLCERKRLYYSYLRAFYPDSLLLKRYTDDPRCPPLTERFCYSRAIE